jgi:hypothetical protein
MNRRVAGQILRYVGLLIEMLGILAVALSSRQENIGPDAPGGLSPRQIWIVVGTGFVLWLAGNVLTYWPGNDQTGRIRAGVSKHDLEL